MNDGAAEKKPKATRAEQASVTRQRLLAAATEVIQQDGAGSLTLDRVAAQASISKGGLLHHFATKDDLIVSLLNETLGAASDELDRRTRKYERSHGSFAFAYLDYVLDPYVEATSIASSILAAAALDEAMLADARDTFAHWQQRLIDDDGISEMAALLAR
ncbi:MAG: helix-turn-helix domain-containing protein, partial [Actinomycetota bacterium]